MTLTTTVYSPGSAYSCSVDEREVLRLRGPVGLPLVVEGVVLVVPVHCPVVDPLRPVRDRLLHVRGNVIERDHEVVKRQRDLRACCFTLDGERGQLEEADIALLDCPLFEDLAGMRTSRRSMPAFSASWRATSFSSKAKSQPRMSTLCSFGASLPVRPPCGTRRRSA